MRVTGGAWGGRLLRVPKAGVRPTQDSVRQAVFNSIGSAIVGARVLDLFAGTGAYGIEALSRGAVSAVWMERDAKTLAVVRANVGDVCGGLPESNRRCIAGDALNAEALHRAGHEFDFVFADPPYAPGTEEKMGDRLLMLLGAPILKTGGWFLFESPAAAPAPTAGPGWSLLRERRAGGSIWRLYRKNIVHPSPQE